MVFTWISGILIFPPQDVQNASFQKQVNRLVKFEKDLSQIPLPHMHQAQLDLLDVMCPDQSELTNQVIKQKGKAGRFGLAQGDLSTQHGQQNLFTQMVCLRPKNF